MAGAVGGRALAIPSRRCTCRRGYGDAGCNVAVPGLAAGQMVERTVPVAAWLHFQINVSAFPALPWCLRTGSFRSNPFQGSPRTGGVSLHIWESSERKACREWSQRTPGTPA